jgi:membrane dipeptidase
MMKRLLIALLVLVVLAAAFAHWILPGRIEGPRNVVLPHQPYAISEAAQRLHDTLFVADLHSDSLLWKRDLTRRSDIGHVDLPRLQEGNVALQVFSATTKSPSGQNYESNTADSDQITLLAVASLWPPRTWFSLYERAVYQLEKLHDLVDDESVVLIRSKRDLEDVVTRRASGEPVIGAMYLIEGAHPLEGDIENLDRLFEQGLRIIGLTHFFDNELGGSLHGVSGEGLTPFGRSVLRRASELGMIVDIAHASPAMVAEVLALSGSPTILSHGGLKGACRTPRNLPDELMQAFAARGGLLGIGYWDGAVCDPSPEGVVRSIRFAIDLLGVDHVALGSDYDGTVATTFDTSELAVLTDTMLRSGFTEDEIRKVMGENVKRFLLENLPGE